MQIRHVIRLRLDVHFFLMLRPAFKAACQLLLEGGAKPAIQILM